MVEDENGFSYINADGNVKIGPIKNMEFKLSDGNGGSYTEIEEVKYATDFHDGVALFYDSDDDPGYSIAIDRNGNKIFNSYDVAGDMFLNTYKDGMSLAQLIPVAGMNCSFSDTKGNAREIDMDSP